MKKKPSIKVRKKPLFSLESPISLELYRIASYFLASRFLGAGKHRDTVSFFPYVKIWNEKKEIQNSLIVVATHLRMTRDDETYSKAPKVKITRNGKPDERNFWKDKVGFLREPIGKARKPLALEQACNKIIHATRIEFEEVNTREEEEGHWVYHYLIPFVHFYGSRWKNGVEELWHARLDILPFVSSGFIAGVGGKGFRNQS